MSLLYLLQGGIICVNSLRQTSQAAGQSKKKKKKLDKKFLQRGGTDKWKI